MDIKAKFSEMSILSPILMAYTTVYFGLMICDFAAREAFNLPGGMMVVYIAFVGAYAANKEYRRWTGKEEPPRAGSFFVYLWAIFFLVAFVIQSFWPTFVVPKDLSNVVLQVLGIFFGSKVSKKVYEIKSGKNPEIVASRKETTLSIIKKNGKVTKKEIVTALKISRSTAGRLLADMEGTGLIKQVGGDEKDTHYVLA